MPNMPETQLARKILAQRMGREIFFANELFGEPAWDMLLDLYVCRASGKEVSVTSLCIASCVPQTTALRYIGLLEEKGMIVSKRSNIDARRRIIELTEQGWTQLDNYLKRAVVDEEAQAVKITAPVEPSPDLIPVSEMMSLLESFVRERMFARPQSSDLDIKHRQTLQ
ncbi:DNA-binding MarR family transcriptional regulator [Croceicoccus naphthovorans]|nr:DNA-binding MarR family transcriptional regulator [Croceicoccus naphthovorans]